MTASHTFSPRSSPIPRKAVLALKWTVREMENRYRKMSKLGVRNIDGFNARLAEAQAKGESLVRKVQTGFDPETGQPIFEPQPFDTSELPLIVVVVDEMADLMLVAGKEIEAAIQRLAQMARAAGIHLIMATQRPSVDVITGTIKANFPTRISFQVTSKIDSRTILGEGGAEQLLGRGDMLYMAGGGRITRVHGPFVSDEEVERVVSFLKTRGEPDYIDEITEDDDALLGPLEGEEEGGLGDALYGAGGCRSVSRAQGVDQLRAAPSSDRLQSRRPDHRANGSRGHRQPRQPRRQARGPGAGRRLTAIDGRGRRGYLLFKIRVPRDQTRSKSVGNRHSRERSTGAQPPRHPRIAAWRRQQCRSQRSLAPPSRRPRPR